MTRIAFIGAGSTIFMKNIVGDAMLTPALADAEFALMDVDPARLEDSARVARKMAATLGSPAKIEATTDRRRALDGADFVVVAFQIGGYRPSTVIDFEVPRRHGLRQTIGDTLGVAGIMRGLRTVPHLWAVAEDMQQLCPDALMLQYVNPMAINCWALAERFPRLKVAGLCHSVVNTVEEIGHDLDLPPAEIEHRVAGINHVAFFLTLAHQGRDLYPALREGWREGRLPKPPLLMPRCGNHVRYEVMDQLGWFCTESSEHLAEYTPWFIKRGRDDLIERFGIPLDEYPKRCEEQQAGWAEQAEALRRADRIEVEKSHEFAAELMAAQVSGVPIRAYANLPNRGQIPQLPLGAVVETPCLVDENGVQPTTVADIPPQLIALMRTQINVQELTVRALLDENVEHLHHAAMMDPHTAAELDLRQIRALMDELLAAHGEMIPAWARPRRAA
ncbi:MAG: alpha-glucosidase/alpha-galactosidase [Pseudomonadota bacterium]